MPSRYRWRTRGPFRTYRADGLLIIEWRTLRLSFGSSSIVLSWRRRA